MQNSLLTLALVNATTNKIVPGYEDLGKVDAIALEKLDFTNYSVVAQVNPNHPQAQSVKSVKFESPLGQQIESVKPYALFGNVNEDFSGKNFNLGNFSLKATAYTLGGGTGQVVETVNVSYDVVDKIPAPAPTPVPQPITPPTLSDSGNVVEVNLNVLHKVGGLSEFDRQKWINTHTDLGSADWKGESEKLNYLFNELDANFGRNVGALTWSTRNFTPQQLPSALNDLRKYYGTRTDIHKYEPKTQDFIVAYKTEIFDSISGTEAGRRAAEYINNVYGSGGTSGSPKPQYFELMNEPLVGLWKNYNYSEAGRDKIFDYLQDTTTAFKADAPDVKIGGFTAAWPTLAPNNFRSWNNDWKNFIDRMGSQMDFYSIHLYDNPTKDFFRTGSNNEAIMDMIEHYGELTGKNHPFVISEYGGLTGDLGNQQWSSQRDWTIMKSVNNMMLQFMERPDQVLKAVPFIVGKAEWAAGDGTPYSYRLMRKANEPNSYSGNWEWTDLIKFYELWDDVDGSRVDSVDNNINIQTDAYVDGNKAYVILNSLSTDVETVNLNLNGVDNNAIQSVEVRNLFNNGQGAALTVSNQTLNLNSSLELKPGATMIAEYTFKNNVLIDEVSEETKYYADKYLQSISANNANSFKINGVTDSINGEAILRIGVGRDDNRSLTPVIKVNGTTIDSSIEYRGDDQLKRDGFFGVLEVAVPYDLIQANNTVNITFPDNGGHISSLAMQVFNFSDDIRGENPAPNPTPTPNPTPIPNPTPVPRNFIIYEAESMQLGGEYKVENLGVASGGKGISLRGGAVEGTGTAKFNFNGAAGNYNVKIHYFDENDGVGKINLKQGNQQIGSVNLNKQLGSTLANASTLTSTEIKNVSVKAGETFTLEGFEDGTATTAEHIRIDKVEFIRTAEPIRINAGGGTITDRIGNQWMADKYFQGGNTYSTNAGIDKTQDDKLFQSERYAKDLSYAIPVKNGSYKVNFNFAEIYFNQNNQRVFDVKAENQIVLDNFDIHQGAGGKNIAVEKTFDVNVQDGVLNLELDASVNNAKLSGIEILPA